MNTPQQPYKRKQQQTIELAERLPAMYLRIIAWIVALVYAALLLTSAHFFLSLIFTSKKHLVASAHLASDPHSHSRLPGQP